MLKSYRPHILVGVALALVALSGWQGSIRNALADLRFKVLQRNASGDVVVIAIDTPSIDSIGVWPWPRRLHAHLLRQLGKADAGDIALDIDFSASSDETSDRNFLEALRDASGSVILPSFQQPDITSNDPTALHINRPLKQFADQSWAALINIPIDSDGRARRYPFGDKIGSEYLPSMSALLAGKYGYETSPFLIDFGIRANSVPTISYIDVLRGEAATLSRLKGKKVIVGGTALELGDRFSVPNGKIVSGPVIQALAAESILQDRTLRWTSSLVTLVQVAVLFIIMIFAWGRWGPGTRVLILLGTAFVGEAAAILLQFEWPVILDTSLLDTASVAYLAALALDEIDFRGLLGRIAELRFRRIAMSLTDGLVCTDHNYRVTFWNPAAEVIFGYSAVEMMGKRIDTISDAPSIGSAKPLWFNAEQAVEEFSGRRRDGEVIPVEASFSAWRGPEGYQYGIILRDITVRKREADRIRYMAEYDFLTGLANRYTLQSALAAMIQEKLAGGIALLVLGIDGFMNINDLLGHTCGDRVLQAVAQRLKHLAGSEGLVARLSGDEFAIVMPCAALPYPVGEFAERLVDAFDRPLISEAREHRLKISTGVAIYPEGGANAGDLLSNAHLAFCRAKGPRRGGHVMFDTTMREELEARVTLEAELTVAVERGEFELFYQPQVHLCDNRLSGAEALIRWRHPERGLVPPMQFMPVVNSSSLSERLANWVMETACKQAREWELSGHSVRVGVNLSPSQLQTGDLAESVAKMLDTTGLSPGLLELEVTEDILLHDETKVLNTFQRIQELGVRVVFDDFGTGYASLSYLKKFPLDGLKIDKSFVFDLLSDSDDAAIVSSTVGLSKQLGLSVIAEGIENLASADLLLTMGCEEGQGYFFGKPMPVREFEAKFFGQVDAGLMRALELENTT